MRLYRLASVSVCVCIWGTDWGIHWRY